MAGTATTVPRRALPSSLAALLGVGGIGLYQAWEGSDDGAGPLLQALVVGLAVLPPWVCCRLTAVATRRLCGDRVVLRIAADAVAWCAGAVGVASLLLLGYHDPSVARIGFIGAWFAPPYLPALLVVGLASPARGRHLTALLGVAAVTVAAVFLGLRVFANHAV